ncbi:hypothetical protein SEPCBS57363_004738 [Sporothrix epigloea]|uniref:Uncharacterized protein n=1 Tax=Sporothrix epigloea TaxID=1892477 RepID=A0ABP0DWL7_9PEZI
MKAQFSAVLTFFGVLIIGGLVCFCYRRSQRDAEKQAAILDPVNNPNFDVEQLRVYTLSAPRSRGRRRDHHTRSRSHCSSWDHENQSAEAYELHDHRPRSQQCPAAQHGDFVRRFQGNACEAAGVPSSHQNRSEVPPAYTKFPEEASDLLPSPAYTANATIDRASYVDRGQQDELGQEARRENLQSELQRPQPTHSRPSASR